MMISTGARGIRWPELACEGVAEVDRDGGERCRAEGDDEDRDQGTKGRFCFDFENEFHDRARASQAKRSVSRAKGVKGSVADGRECRNNRS